LRMRNPKLLRLVAGSEQSRHTTQCATSAHLKILAPGRARIAILLVLLLLAIFVPLLPAAAAEGDIVVTTNTYRDDYPNQIRFSLGASSGSEIKRVLFYYKIEPSPVLTYAFPPITPGNTVTAEYVWNIQRRYIPPGVTMQYYWVIENAAGSKIKTDPKTFVVEDTRFHWQRLSQANVNLYWYQGDRNFADTLMSFTQDALSRLAQEVGVQISGPISIYIYASKDDLLGALEPKAQEWTGGRALSEQGLIVLQVEPTRSGLTWAEGALPHELSHLVIGQVTENPYGDIPHWLDEGLAMRAEGELSAEFRRSLDAAVRENQLISIRSLASNFPTDANRAVLSYAESYSIVSFILKQYGREKMAQLLETFREGTTYDDALKRALGVDLDGLEEQWRASLGLPPLDEASVPTPTAGVAAGNQAQPEHSDGFCFGIGPAIALGVLSLLASAKFIHLR